MAKPEALHGRIFGRCSMSSSSLRLGVIGTGHVARRAHLPAWTTLPDAELVALCDTDPEALDAAQRCIPQRSLPAFDNARDLLAADMDAVSVCTPNMAHFPIVLAALEAGKHVLCEKPLCVTADEVKALGAAADKRGLILMVRHPLRFGTSAREAIESMRAGAAGEVRHVRVRALRRDRIPTLPGLIDRTLAGGGVALDLGVHALDMALWLMDFPRVTAVTGTVQTRYGRDPDFVGRWGGWDRARFTVEDTASGHVRFDNGVTLSIECAWAGDFDPAEEGLSCTVSGDRGTVHWAAGESPEPSQPDFAAFLAAIRTGGPSPVSWREALPSIAILEGLYRSAQNGREVALY